MHLASFQATPGVTMLLGWEQDYWYTEHVWVCL